MSNKYITALQEVADNTQPAIEELKQVCEAVKLSTGNMVNCWIKLGFPTTNFGQEYRIMISTASDSYEQVLLRAYVPLDGKPITLNLFTESVITCEDIADLQDALTNFLQDKHIRSTIQQLKKLSANLP